MFLFKVVRVEQDQDTGSLQYFTQCGYHRTEWKIGEKSEAYGNGRPLELCSSSLLHASLNPLGTWPFTSMLFKSPSEYHATVSLLSLHTVTLPKGVQLITNRSSTNSTDPEESWKVGAPRMVLGPAITGTFALDRSHYGGVTPLPKFVFASVTNGVLQSNKLFRGSIACPIFRPSDQPATTPTSGYGRPC